MKPRARVRIAVVVALLAGVVILTALALRSRSRRLSVERGADGAVLMPKVVMTDLDRTGRQLTGMGLAVHVHRRATQFVPPGTSTPLTLGEISRPFVPGEWTHLIAAQDPAVGVPLAPGARVTLVVGTHHGAGPFLPWVETHGRMVELRGDARCGACHATPYCSECHDRWRKR